MAAGIETWYCPDCSTPVDISALGFYAEVKCPSCGRAEHVHTLLANFRLEGLQGIGGMSVVLRGRDVVLNRPVAIKLLNETYRDRPERIARFENECSLMAKVRHENVVSVYSAGWAKEQFYIAMELLDGHNLESLVTKNEPLQPLRAIDITLQIAKGLEAAYHSGMLHRDMKPGNVIITPSGVAKVLDFGLAQADTEEDTEEVIWATPYYVAPETLQRAAEDARTDIYSLGMTLRYLLTGIESLGESQNSVSALLEAKHQLPPLEKVLPRADESLCDLVNHMTQFSPADRHDNYADLLAELQEVHSVLKEKLLVKTSPRKRMIRMRNRLIAAASVLVAGLGAYFAGYYLGTPDAEQRVLPVGASSASLVTNVSATQAAFKALRQSRWEKALEYFTKCSTAEAEPAQSAWAALHGAALAYMLNKEASTVDAFVESYRSAVQRLGASGLVRDDISRQLQTIAQALDAPEKLSAVADRRLLGLAHILAVRHYLLTNRADRAKAAIASAMEEFKLVGKAPYDSCYYEHTQQIATMYTAVFYIASYQETLQLLAEHRFSDAERKLAELQEPSTEKSEEVRVLTELCGLGKTLQDTLMRLMKDDYAPGLNAEAFSLLNREKKFVEPLREQEICTLLHLLNHSYAAAFDTNPYKAEPDSNAPLAILLRDWQKRLAPYMNE